MAKLKAPLLSLGASGAVGKTLVFFTWKGLDVVREFVIPANPKTTLQKTQRDYLKDAVTDIHAAQTHATDPMLAADFSAYALWGSCYPTPRTWFNQAIKNWIDQKVDSLFGTVFRKGGVTPGVDQLDISLRSDEIEAAKITAGKFYYGTSKTALINSVDAVINLAANMASKVITGLATGTKYYIQFRATAEATYVGIRSGIYHGTPT